MGPFLRAKNDVIFSAKKLGLERPMLGLRWTMLGSWGAQNGVFLLGRHQPEKEHAVFGSCRANVGPILGLSWYGHVGLTFIYYLIFCFLGKLGRKVIMDHGHDSSTRLFGELTILVRIQIQVDELTCRSLLLNFGIILAPAMRPFMPMLPCSGNR